jgi:ATP-dependent DNA ligase
MNQKPNEIPYEEVSPMLCYPYWDLKPAEQKEVWKDDGPWAAQEKLNGCRVILHFVKGVGVFAHSRRVSKQTGRRQVLTDRLLFSDLIPTFSATVDAEAMVDRQIDTRPYTSGGQITKSTLQSTSAILRLEPEASKSLQRDQNAALIFHTFDIVSWEGTDLKTKPFCERFVCLDNFKAAITQAQLAKYFAFSEVRIHEKKAFFEEVISKGGEGVILKNLNSLYEASTARNRRGWIKVKREVEFTAYVSGHERGKFNGEWKNKVGCLVFSILTEKGPHEIAKVTNFTYDFRKEMSVYDPATNKVELSPLILGSVATVTGVEISQRAKRLSHPKVTKWRDDLKREDCFYPTMTIEGDGWGQDDAQERGEV